MSTYCLVHLSDIHTKESSAELIENFQKAAGAVAVNGTGDTKTIIFLITGDIANSGKSEEYQILSKCLNEVKCVLTEKGFSTKFFFAPGNHDCDFTSPLQTVRALLVKNSAHAIMREKPAKGIFESFLAIQKSFFNFTNEHGCLLNEDQLLTQIEDTDLRLKVTVLNTAWASELHENDNRPFVIAELDSLEAKPGFLNIVLSHHPKSWIDKQIVGEFSKKVHEATDLFLSGHEHSSSTYETKYIDGESQIYFEAGSFSGTEGESKFRTILVNIEKAELTVTDFEWITTERVYKGKTYDKIPIPKNPQTNSLGLWIDPKFLKYLKDPGVNLKHSMKRDLELKDFFVFPRLTIDADLAGENGPLKIIANEQEFFEHIKIKKLNLIAGDDKAGKTSLCKVLFESIFARGELPVLIDGSDIKSPSPVVLKNLIDEKIKRQFKNSAGINLLQTPNIKAILIIDRFDQISLEPRKVGEALAAIGGLFQTLIFTADSSIEVSLLDDPRFGVSSDEISRMQVGPLSTTQRKLLITNWLSIGNSIEVDESDSKTHQLELYISSLISEYGIPSYPLFILTYLQFADSENNLNLKISSNAKLLETLVDLGLSSVLDQRIPYQAKVAYLRELGFYMHSKSQKSLSADEIKTFHKSYCERLDIDISQNEMWRELCEAKVLTLDEEGIGCFKYGYFRSFFVAGYLQFNSSSEASNSHLKSIVENFHISENANIIATLSLFTSETWILETLKMKLDNTLKSFPSGDYRELSSVIKDVTKIESFPLLVAPKENDSDEETVKQTQQPELTDVALEMSYAIKLIKVLGQLIRNSANAIDGKLKKDLIESIFLAGSRILSVQTSALKNGKDDILLFLYHRLKEKRPTLAEPDIKSEAARRLMFLIFGSSVSLIDVISRSVGDEFLALTFKRIDEDDSDDKFDFYFFGIKLDWFKSFPKSDALKLYEETEGKGYIGFLVKYLTFRGMAFRGNDIGAQVIQEICTKMELDHRRLQIKSLTSSRKPRID